MATTYTIYVSDGVTDTFTFSFELLSPADVRVQIDSVDTAQDDATNPWSVNSLSNPTAVVFDSAPAAGQQIRLYRDTNRAEVYKTFDNGPLVATDMTNSFKKILFIEQEAYDKLIEVEGIFQGGGSLPQPSLGQENDHLLITAAGNWVVRSATQVRDAMGLGNTDDVIFGSLTADTIEANSVSGVSGICDTFIVNDHVRGPLTIGEPDADYARLRAETDTRLVVEADQDIRFHIGGAEKWRLTQNTLHTYGDDFPTSVPDLGEYGICLSGANSYVLAANTPKVWGRIESHTFGTGFTGYGVSSVVSTGNGLYKLEFDTDAVTFADNNYACMPTIISNNNATYAAGVYIQDQDYVTISTYEVDSNAFVLNQPFTIVIY